jgi:D-alanyl-lipoteichoic acid acyltransferase DltB (MBOAT superfamily)
LSFVSVEFFVLLLVTYVAFHATERIRLQNVVILVASYIFYGWWDWRLLPMLVGLSLFNYAAALLISGTDSEARRRALLVSAIVAALLVLGVFKYFNFFVDTFAATASWLGYPTPKSTLQIILPLGISFITFQGMAYVIDVYRGQHTAERNVVTFLAFKAFFPQLVAGPIERASNLLDQFNRHRKITETTMRRALWLMVYGYAMKIIVADSMGSLVDPLFVNNQQSGWSVVLGTVAFGVQIYADFCGYSLIAKGVALLYGFDLIWNFRFPYWSVSISDFWRRWHISLSNWLRDYLYIPLGGNRRGTPIAMRNMLITMTLGGLWHGASWNFVFWGILHGVALGVWRLLPIATVPSSLPGRVAGWTVTMTIVFVGWFLFRANTWPVLSAMVGALANWQWAPAHGALLQAIILCSVPVLAIEFFLKRRGDFAMIAAPRWATVPLYSCLAALIVAFAGQTAASFIYFQF